MDLKLTEKELDFLLKIMDGVELTTEQWELWKKMDKLRW